MILKFELLEGNIDVGSEMFLKVDGVDKSAKVCLTSLKSCDDTVGKN